MTEEEFSQKYWKYYRYLEDDFLATEKYVAYDDYNFKTYSTEYIKIIQMTCAEIDVICKVFSKLLEPNFKGDTLSHCCKTITQTYPDFTKEEVLFKPIKEKPLIPWDKWTWKENTNRNGKKSVTGDNPQWWRDHNQVKHNRTIKENYKKASLRNTILSLAALFQVESYIYKYLAGKNVIAINHSKLFTMKNWAIDAILLEETVIEPVSSQETETVFND